ncbi:MAG: type II secretion system inner membrane protein GspF [Syntrophus sp. (in: bacteria)]
MPVYEYIALNAGGQRLKGIIDAGGVAAARQKLRETDLFPTELKELSGKEREEGLAHRLSGGVFKKVGLREIALLTRQLATLLGAGLPLVPSLTTLVNQTSHPVLKKTLSQIKEEVNEGSSLTQSMSGFPQIFPPYYVNMVRAGEASGTIDIVLGRLADFNESQQALQTKIRSTLAYPIFMFLVGSIVLFFLVTFVVPNITGIFEEMHQTLPGITVFLIVVSSFLKTFWWIIMITLAGAFLLFRYLVTKTTQGDYLWDKIKLKTPLVGSLIKKIAVARFSRTLGTLLQSGVPLLTALEIVKNIVSNRLIADEIHKAAKDVEEGQNLSAPLSQSGLFPPIAIAMIAIGEQSGNLEVMLYRIADAYERDVEASVLVLTSMLEPIMILSMGLIVGFIVISVLLPIFEMNQLVR